MADRKSIRLRRLAAATRREAAMAKAVVKAYNRLFAAIRTLLAASGYSPDVLDTRVPAWRNAVDELVAPEVTAAYLDAMAEAAREGVTIDAQKYAVAYLATVDNRLVGVADHAFDLMRTQLSEGVAKGEGIPELAARIDTLLTDEQRWHNRGVVVARTEVVGAMNAGHYDAAYATAKALEVPAEQVAKEWLATQDTHTRATHHAADGEKVMGLATKFHVGATRMLRPGDPEGGPDEVIQCRCSALYHLPGDPDYPEGLTAGGTTMDTDRLARLFDVSQMPPKLQEYWLGPEGAAKIGYDTPGQFVRCQAALAGKVPAKMVDGTCANLIHKATGKWPGKGHDGAAAVVTAAAPGPMVPPPPGGELPADVAPYEPEDEEPNTGLWIGLLPAADEVVHGIGPEEKHCTMFYLGETTQFTDQDHTDLATLLQQWATTTPAESCEVTGMDTLGKPGMDGALVWLLDDELQGSREALAATPLIARLLQVAADLQFPTYLPHVTCGYPTSQSDDTEDTAWPAIIAAAEEVTGVRFDRVAMWWGDDQSAEWPLTGDTPPTTGEQPEEAQSPQEEAVTAAAPEAPVQTEAETNTDLTWVGVLAPEGVTTGDKRKFATGSIVWLASPVVLKAMFADKPGHDDSVPVGLILGIERTPEGLLKAHGTWDTGENAVEARRQNIAGLLRGVSVDLDDTEISFETADGQAIEGDDLWDLAMDEEPTLVINKGRIRAATLWCTPAFVEAYVLDSTVATEVPDTSIVEASGTSPLGLAASALYAETTPAPTAAPAAAFANPGLTEPTSLTVTDDGRVFGHLATWGVCHIGIEGACVTPPNSNTDYAYFATGMYQTSDGEVLPVGTLTMGTGHADLSLNWRPTVDHYDHTGTAAAYFNIGEDEVGIWFAGALAEDLPEAQRLALMRTGSVSGDWRAIGGNLELVAALAVNVPGFPIPQTRSRVASLAAAGGLVVPTALVASGIVAHTEAAAAARIDYRLLAREVSAYQKRQARTDAVHRRVRKLRQGQLAGRIKRG